MTQMKTQMKTLTRVRLINWHFFTDETIDIKGSALFTGDNASGKSTILDAIQMVLTTNTTRFNPAANEKSKRDLRGYVRCKTGEENNAYVRSQGMVISFVALEFYEESRDRYFVIGVKLDSPDLEADINKKWFYADGRLDSITFIVDGRPVKDSEFTQDGKRIKLEHQVGKARDDFRIRLGRLDDTYQQIISSAMAFKPMNHVKDFIYQYILPQSPISTENLQQNIRNLQELQKLLNEVRSQIEHLKKITEQSDIIEEKQGRILVIDILISIAALDAIQQRLNESKAALSKDEMVLESLKTQKQQYDEIRSDAEKLSTELAVAMANNECSRLIDSLRDSLAVLARDKDRAEEDVREYRMQLAAIGKAVKGRSDLEAYYRTLTDESGSPESRTIVLGDIRSELDSEKTELLTGNARKGIEAEEIKAVMLELEERINRLRKNQPVYNSNTTGLLDAINAEFDARHISAPARVFADLLEIRMPEWRDAVEGYLNTQRFNIIVEPQYFDIAAEVYQRLKGKYHSVGLVDVKKIMEMSSDRTEGTLAEVVSSENRFARAYADYILGRVVRCEDVTELKQHEISITRDCMKYQGHVLSRINPEIYRTPYLGQDAIRIQLQNAEKELALNREKKTFLEKAIAAGEERIGLINGCNFDRAGYGVNSAEKLNSLKEQIRQKERELKEAQSDPSYIELGIKRNEAENALNKAKLQCEEISKKIINKERDIIEDNKAIEESEDKVRQAEEEKNRISSDHLKAAEEANALYRDSLKSYEAGRIAENYGPRRKTLENQIDAAKQRLIELQAKYKDGDFGTGMEVMDLYREDLEKLERSDLLSYEDKLAKAQSDCELEFREDFLARLRENIENARIRFNQLNRSLKDVYYGNDSYKFELKPNPERQSLYDMITSEMNVEGMTLFSTSFEDKYHEEMEDLFLKLTDEDLANSSTVNELTDYRSYLDYDIQIINKEGKIQYFSKTYGEKSGGETQTPYYVAMAASFAQLYSGRETMRIMMMDEAFNNMDEDRIESMMTFLRSQGFQLILAAPSSRMEMIGEYVDSIFLVLHKGQVSTVEEYYL